MKAQPLQIRNNPLQPRRLEVDSALDRNRARAPFAGASIWPLFAVCLPTVLVPLFIVFLFPDWPVTGGYALVLINENQKFAAELFALSITFGMFLLAWNRKQRWPLPSKALIWPLLCFVLALCASLLQAVALWRGVLVGLQVYLLPVMFFLLVATRRWSRPQGLSILLIALLAGAPVSLVGVAQGFDIRGFALALPHLGAGSLFYFQNLAGEYLIILIPSAIAMSFMPSHWFCRVCAVALSGLFLIHLVLTLARGAWVGLLGGLCIGTALAGCALFLARGSVRKRTPDKSDQRQLRNRCSLLLGTLVLLLLTALLLGQNSPASSYENPYLRELLSINLGNTTGRLQIWSDSLNMLKDHWLMGVGPGHYKVLLPAYLREIPSIPYLFNWNVRTGEMIMPFRAHNDYLQTWLELGLAGAVAMTWLFAAIIWIAARGLCDAAFNGDRFRFLMILGPISGFAAWAVSMLFEFPFRMPATLVLGWLCAGLAVSFSLRSDVYPRKLTPLPITRLAAAAAWLLVLVSLSFAYRLFWSDIYVNQAIMAEVNRDTERGYAWIRTAEAYTPWEEQTGGSKARLELYLDNPEGALESARESLQSNPYSLPGLWAYGLAAGELGHEEESRAAFQKIVILYPFLPDIERYRQFAGN